jgi:cellulose synthase/poly-beta-1,6-N-acetylglucosamine synthase-like glycosyltransferase
MIAITFFSSLFLLAFFVWQAVLTVRFVSLLRRKPLGRLEDEACPKTAVILCVRGKDPYLQDCLDGLSRQDYPHYDIRVIVDHESDPAFPVVQAARDRNSASNLKAGILENRRDTCTLKCSSLVEAVEDLDDTYEAIALIDADTVPHAGWLRELMTPFQDSKIGATTGNRWFVPANPSAGAVVRYFWNVFAIVQMAEFRIPWGGSLALKMEAVRESDLLERWSRAFCEDTMTVDVLRKMNLSLAFVPSLIMVNRENCSVRDFFQWVTRQLLTVRLYHPGWSRVLAHGMITSAIPLMIAGVLAAGTWFSNAKPLWMASAALGYLLLMLVLWILIETGIRRVLASRGESVRWMTPLAMIRLAAAIPLLQILYPAVLVKTLRIKEVAWRGMRYEIGGPWKIRYSGYEPYQTCKQKPGESL